MVNPNVVVTDVGVPGVVVYSQTCAEVVRGLTESGCKNLTKGCAPADVSVKAEAITIEDTTSSIESCVRHSFCFSRRATSKKITQEVE